MTRHTLSDAAFSSRTLAVSPAFIEALQADSNLELDWLWLADQNISAAERRYSLRCALAINPDSAPARQALHGLAGAPSAPAPEFGAALQGC
jgi:hypothetical protein